MSKRPPTIALDAMGGDHAPGIVVDGAALAFLREPTLRFILVGDRQKIESLLNKHPTLKAACQIEEAASVVPNDMKASLALRQGKDSSMRLAINAVEAGKADAVVSAGNTGALMAMAKLVLRPLPGIERPAIASLFPTTRGECVMLDLGANIECDARNLVEFARMGALFARVLLGLEQPLVGLLNVGSEEQKGHEEIRTAHAQLKAHGLPGQFYGFIEGNDIPAGTVDVVVTDGFTGNIALKMAEGMGRFMSHLLRHTFSASWLSRLGYLFARGAFARLRIRLDPRKYNGGVFLGLQGICVKSHGGADAEGYANAISVAHDLVRGDLNARIAEELKRHENEAMTDATLKTAAGQA